MVRIWYKYEHECCILTCHIVVLMAVEYQHHVASFYWVVFRSEADFSEAVVFADQDVEADPPHQGDGI